MTDWNPLTVWVYEQSYVRFALMDYDPHVKARYAHLTNNCLVKKYKKEFKSGKKGGVPIKKLSESPDKFSDKQSFGSESESEGEEELGNIWSREDFAAYL